jgi:hypothetical protein
MNIKINFKLLLLFGIFLISSMVWNTVQAQIAPNAGISIKINTPVDSANVPIGDLTIHGMSSDDDTTNCQVYADWNDLKPMQNVTASGTKGNADYSSWSFTYSGSYHNIVEGPNELTSKITCYDQGQNASSKFYSVNVTGTTDGNENTNNTVQTSDENTDNDVSNVLPLKNNNSNSADNTVQTSDENTDNDVSNVLPLKNNNSKGTYKILPLYSEPNEESIHAAASQDGDKTEEVTTSSTDTSESQDGDKTEEVTTTGTDTTESQDGDKTGEVTTTGTDTTESQDSDKTGEVTTTGTDTTESQDQEELNDTDTNTYFTHESEQQEETGETTTTDISESQFTDTSDKALSSDTDTNTHSTFESEQEKDEELNGNNDNSISNSPFDLIG